MGPKIFYIIFQESGALIPKNANHLTCYKQGFAYFSRILEFFSEALLHKIRDQLSLEIFQLTFFFQT